MKRKNQTRPTPQSKENGDTAGDDTDCEEAKLDPELKLLNTNSQSGPNLVLDKFFKTAQVLTLYHLTRAPALSKRSTLFFQLKSAL